MAARQFLLLPRVLYAFVVAYWFLVGGWSEAAFGFFVFIGSLPLLFLERRFSELRGIDAAIIALFLLAAIPGIVLEASILGLDKLFHLAAGAILGFYAMRLLQGRVDGRWLAAVLAISVAVCIGAGWEVFEWALFGWQDSLTALSYPDSMLDLIADGIGAMIGALFAARKEL